MDFSTVERCFKRLGPSYSMATQEIVGRLPHMADPQRLAL
jgi:hypothetical protein